MSKIVMLTAATLVAFLPFSTPPAAAQQGLEVKQSIEIEGDRAPARGERDRKWDRRKHGERWRHRHGKYRHYHDGYYYAVPWWTVGVPVVVVPDRRIGISCRRGERIVERHGFYRVRPIRCEGDIYRYQGWRRGDPWRIRVSAFTGDIISMRRIH
jgi:hypothetical protein